MDRFARSGVRTGSNRTFVPDSDGTEFLILVIHGKNATAGNVALSSYGSYIISTSGDYSAGMGPNLIPNKPNRNSTVYSASGTLIWKGGGCSSGRGTWG